MFAIVFPSQTFLSHVPMQNAAIKKMDMQASKEFLAELRVLTRVHHLNLVRHFLSKILICSSAY